jgi:DNA helicase-2/ATP-dependent DNA helicase PcrA
VLGRILNLNFKEGRTFDPEGDWYLPGDFFDDAYLRIYDRSRLRMVSFEQEFKEAADYTMSYPALTQMVGTWESYKAVNGKLDFTDMLLKFLQVGETPRLELLIVDEAQDLTPLQWAVVRRLMETTKETYFAGDDDQAIHTWAGVDIKLFLGSSDDKKILDQSFRIPRKVYDLAETVVQRIHVRQPKFWMPTDCEGSVSFHMDRRTVPLEQGSWTLMARTNFQVNELAKSLREDGVFYSRGRQRSVSLPLSQGIESWFRLMKGETLTKDEVKALMKRLPKSGKRKALMSGATAALDTGDPEGQYSLELLQKDYGLLINSGGVEVFGLTDDEEIYIRSLLREGVKLTEDPKIKLSTVHAMKGGEDDNIMLLTDSTRNCALSPDQDSECRVWYTGITRTKENLHVVESNRKYRYQI